MPGEIPVGGDTCSHAPPEVVAATALKLVGVPVSVSDWAPGTAPPSVYANASDCGVTPILPTEKVTCTTGAVPVPPDTVIVPV